MNRAALPRIAGIFLLAATAANLIAFESSLATR
jgi:hypothetical protein